jgi:hypothetical protein
MNERNTFVGRRGHNDPSTKRFTFKYNEFDKIIEMVPGLDREEITDYPYVDSMLVDYDYSKYHRKVRMSADAVNETLIQTGISDPAAIIALTTKEEVYFGTTYMLPLEMVLRTPLEYYNPYDVPMLNRSQITGDGTEDNPFNGGSIIGFNYFMPEEMFDLNNWQPPRSNADTNYYMWVTDSNGNKRHNFASGIWIFLPKFKWANDDDWIRLRYPVYLDALENGPIGHLIWREHNH